MRQKAEATIAEKAVHDAAARYGLPRDIPAADALIQELHRTQGHVDWLAHQVAEDPTTAMLSVYQAERAQLARLAQAVMSTRADERRNVLTEQLLDRMETAIGNIVRELGHDPRASHVRSVIARHLTANADPTSPKRIGTVSRETAPRTATPQPIAF